MSARVDEARPQAVARGAVARSPALALGIALACGALAGLVAGCTISRIRTGRPVDAAAAALIEPGTSKRDVLTRLGPPDVVGTAPQGSTFQYYFATEDADQLQLSFFRANFQYEQVYARFDRLYLRFDARGLVTERAIVTATAAPR